MHPTHPRSRRVSPRPRAIPLRGSARARRHPQPLPLSMVAAVRAAGWELVPAGWIARVAVGRIAAYQGLTAIHDELAGIVPTLDRVLEAATREATARDERRPDRVS